MFEYTIFLFANLWSYTFIKIKKSFSKKAGIIFSIFVAKISYFTLISSIFFGISSFGFKNSIIGLFLCVLFVEIIFLIGRRYLDKKTDLLNKISKIKFYLEFLIIVFFIIYIIKKFN